MKCRQSLKKDLTRSSRRLTGPVRLAYCALIALTWGGPEAPGLSFIGGQSGLRGKQYG